MELTRDIRMTVAARVQRDSEFRGALLAEAVNACLAGDTRAGKAVLPAAAKRARTPGLRGTGAKEFPICR